MSGIANGRRVFAAIFIACAALAVCVSHFATPQLAVSRHNVHTKELAARFRVPDAVTDAIRNPNKVISRIDVRGPKDRANAARIGRIVEDYNSFVIVAKDQGIEAKNFGQYDEPIETSIHLPGASFDPLRQPPAGSLRLGNGANANGKGYYILQFGGYVTDEWIKSLTDAGVEVLQYVPNQAFFVYGDDESIARVANHSRVRWIGSYSGPQKISPVLRDQLESAQKGTAVSRGITPIEKTKRGTALFDISVFARADLDNVAALLQERFGKGFLRLSRLRHNFFDLIRIELDPRDVESVAAFPDVVGIEPVIGTRNEDERSNQILAGNYINSTTILGPGYNPASQFGADGTNVTVSVVDDGIGIPGDGDFYISTLNAVNGPLRGAPSGALGHGHLNATIIAGATPYGPVDSLFYNYGIGVAPRANIVSIPRNRNGYTGTDADVYNDSVLTPGPNGAGAYISNNSWGNGTNSNVYSNTVEGAFDGYVQDASEDPGIDPITLVFSAGNAGNDGLTRPKVAKNIISVGNSEGLRSDLAGSNADNMDDIAADSSRGPAADGRIKPDIVAPGTAITGGRSGTDSLSGNIGTFHRWSSGTSHSAAHVTGLAALFAQYWYTANSGERPTPSLIKAALINSARDLNGNGTSASIPNATEGWGRPNLKFMLNTGVGMKYFNEMFTLSNAGDGIGLTGSVADSSKPLRVTLVWSDPPGVTDPALVNNLDLVVTVNGVEYKGNVFSNGSSVPGGLADTRNNVENVFLSGIPAGSSLSVTVRATSLNGDGSLGNGDATDQKYSLVIYNYSSAIAPTFYTVTGQVKSPSSRGVAMAKVRLTDSLGVVHEAFSNPSGYFTFTGVPNGNATVNISTKRGYTFTQQNIGVSAGATNFTFTASNGSP